MNKEQAIELGNSHFWEKMTPLEIAKFQLFEPLLCMPFSVFHEAIEKALGREVWTHEFGMNLEGLKRELMGEAPMPTLDEIMDLIPEEKRIILRAP